MTSLTTASTCTAPPPSSDLEAQVRDRYAKGAREVEAALCCPTTNYDPQLIALLPREIIETDYGCGDPSTHTREGETVIDLGCGSGKICYILSQRVGPYGAVIGLDFNDAMLSLARKYQAEMARKIGYSNVRFHKARIQDMALDQEQAEACLRDRPVANMAELGAFEAACARLRREQPLIGDDSIDLIVSNCVLNLVRPQDKQILFGEMHRVLKSGGRAVISDIVCDEDPPPEVLNDPHLWSGCIAGAFREDRFLEMFEEAGFHGIEVLKRSDQPWQTIGGGEFRAATVRAYKGKQGPCVDRMQSVVYRGPWKQVQDDDGHTFVRGRRMEVCEKTYGLLTDSTGPYADKVIGIDPHQTEKSPDNAPRCASRTDCC